jgi:hypothetical protein
MWPLATHCHFIPSSLQAIVRPVCHCFESPHNFPGRQLRPTGEIAQQYVYSRRFLRCHSSHEDNRRAQGPTSEAFARPTKRYALGFVGVTALASSHQILRSRLRCPRQLGGVPGPQQSISTREPDTKPERGDRMTSGVTVVAHVDQSCWRSRYFSSRIRQMTQAIDIPSLTAESRCYICSSSLDRWMGVTHGQRRRWLF